jgi:multiple sugar transport system substrate-binding protein
MIEQEIKSTKVTLWTNNIADMLYLSKQIDIFNETNQKGIQIEIVIYPDNYEQALDVAYTQNTFPDILYGDIDESTYYRFCRKGAFLELSPYLTNELQNKLSGGIYPEIDGSIYQIYTSVGQTVLIYNKEIFARCGITTPPQTLSQMVKMSKQITAKLSKNGIYGFAQNMKDGEDALIYCLMNGVKRDYGVYDGFDYQKGRYDFMIYHDTLVSLKELLGEESAMPGSDDLSLTALRDLFARGKIAMYFADSAKEYRIYEELFPIEADNYGQVAIPRNKSSKADGVSPVNLSGGWLVSNQTQHKEEALTVLWEFLYSQTYLEGYYADSDETYLLKETGDIFQKQSIDRARLLPQAPHVLNGEAITIQAAGIYEVIYSVLYEGVNEERALQQLTELYNSSYSQGVKKGYYGRLYLPMYDKTQPEETFSTYQEMILPLYTWKGNK